jgi:peroxiredoxin
MRKSMFYLAAVALTAALLTSFAVAGDKEGKDKGKYKDKNGGSQTMAKIGQPAPQFSLQDQNGKTVNLSDFKDKVVVLEWFNEDCPVCARHYTSGNIPSLAKDLKAKDVVYIAVNSTKGKSNDTNKAAAQAWNIDFPLLNDSTGEVGKMYGAKTTPHMYVINKGTLAYMGAIDDDQQGNKSEKKNYVSKAVDEILAGQSVSEPETRPYGCSVKYAN